MSKDYYSILGVSKTATPEEIKKAFRGKAHQYHPDKQHGDEAKFKEASEAYQVLSSPEKRKQYDQFGSTFSGGGPGGFNWSDFTRQGGGGFSSGGINFDFGDMGDIFGDIFGFGSGGGRTRRAARGNDIQAELTVDFMESVFGLTKEIRLDRQVDCSTCGGDGAEPGSSISTCKTCGGSGQVERIQNTILGAMRTATVCQDCRGEGQKIDKPCGACHGTGARRESEDVKIKIPAGIKDGQSIRLSGQGEAGQRGVPAGDLYLAIRVRPSADFKRRGDDIVSIQAISFKQAALGDKINVTTVHGEVSLKIPEGTQSGKVFKLKGKGVPHLGSSGSGDHLVEVVVMTPTRLTRSQKKALEELE
ncbi:molecular chaperone DnaJ [Candidatus Falkowbacteria bacterium]|nr:molecular chaperone DnaJ [Candidatus Falkowbacteria bacterium]